MGILILSIKVFSQKLAFLMGSTIRENVVYEGYGLNKKNKSFCTRT